MCGFVGFIDPNMLQATAENTLHHMLAAIEHRGPDDAGTWHDKAAGVALGHRRLSIVDLSAAGHQPMHSSCGRWVLIFNGEIYNHAELRKDLMQAEPGLIWRGHSDTEVLINAIMHWGLDKALQRCVGMFALALWDRQERTLQLARDRMGEKPLYYGCVGQAFVFGSELAAFYPHPHWQGQINRNALALMMRHNYIPAPYTIFSNVAKLRPAHIALWRMGERTPQLHSYWQAKDYACLREQTPFQGTPEQAVDELELRLNNALSGQMMADVPLGAFLSGGIDSSTVVALMQSMSERPIRTYSIGFHESEYNEAEHAHAIATHLGTKHTEHYVQPQQALDVIPELPTIYSEPFSDSSQIPTYLVSQLARRDVTVALSGDGGDELFCGYSRYTLSAQLWDKYHWAPAWLRQLSANAMTALSPDRWNRLLAPLFSNLPARYQFKNPGDKLHKLADVLNLNQPADMYRRLVSHWETPTKVVIGSEEPPTMLTGLESPPSFTDFISEMMYLDTVSYLPDDILTKVDRAAMSVSLETRVPMLDHRVVEFAGSLPLSILRHQGQSKWPLRQLLYRYVPKPLIERPKMGFGVPIDQWLRGALRTWADDLLEPGLLRQQGFFNAEPIINAWQAHRKGTANHAYLLWDVLCFQAWIAQHQTQNFASLSPNTRT